MSTGNVIAQTVLDLHDALAAKDARIRELEAENATLRKRCGDLQGAIFAANDTLDPEMHQADIRRVRDLLLAALTKGTP